MFGIIFSGWLVWVLINKLYCQGSSAGIIFHSGTQKIILGTQQYLQASVIKERCACEYCQAVQPKALWEASARIGECTKVSQCLGGVSVCLANLTILTGLEILHILKSMILHKSMKRGRGSYMCNTSGRSS